MITQAFPATLELVLAGALVTIVVSLLLGLISGVYHNKLIDTVCRFLAIITASSPPFFVGILGDLLPGLRAEPRADLRAR